MFEDPVAEFKRRLIFLIKRDGVGTYAPSHELTVGDLVMSVGVNSFGTPAKFGGMSFYYTISAYDSEGWVYHRHFVNDKLKESETNLEKIKHYTPMLQQLMVLQDLADA